jgi:hypothetical protein
MKFFNSGVSGFGGNAEDAASGAVPLAEAVLFVDWDKAILMACHRLLDCLFEVPLELPLVADCATKASAYHAVRNAALCWYGTRA